MGRVTRCAQRPTAKASSRRPALPLSASGRAGLIFVPSLRAWDFGAATVESSMVLALLAIIRPLQVPPLWSVQKAAADRIEARKQAAPHTSSRRGTRDVIESRTSP